MIAVHAERTLDAPIDGVFEVLADHANYDRFGWIRRAELVRPGESDRNGVGALRRVAIGPLVFEEAVTEFEPPTRLSYLILKINAPAFRHEGGTVDLGELPGGRTGAVWTSEFELAVPGAGRLLERAIAPVFSRGFASTLADSGRIARGG